jgi:hypothetical protein
VYGDFNGDNLLDMSCHQPSVVSSVALSLGNGEFSVSNWNPGTWCSANNLLVGDYNGDKKADLSCHTADNRHIIAISNGNGQFSVKSAWPLNSAWCNPSSLKIGDLNGDGNTDLLCLSESLGYIVAFSKSDGSFSNVSSWWRPPTSCSLSDLKFGDFNGDLKLDIACYSQTDGISISFSNGNGAFSNDQVSWKGTAPFSKPWDYGVGNIGADPARFPRGLSKISDLLHRNGKKFLVWFEPERVMPGTWLYENRYSWLLPPPSTGLGPEESYMYTFDFHLLNFGNPNARAFITEKTISMIRDYGIDIYRHDFNMLPLQYWKKADGANREGLSEIKYITGLYAFFDSLRAAFPDLLIDNCASGGRRIDIETLRRSYPLLRSDFLWGETGQQRHTLGLSQWLPFTGIGSASSDKYNVRSGSGAFNAYAFPFDSSNPSDWKVMNDSLNEAKYLQELFQGDFDILKGTTSISPSDIPASLDHECVAWQYYRSDLRRGLVQAFRRPNCVETSISVQLLNLEMNITLKLTDLDSGSFQVISSNTLMDTGFTIPLSSPRTAKIFVFEANSPTTPLPSTINPSIGQTSSPTTDPVILSAQDPSSMFFSGLNIAYISIGIVAFVSIVAIIVVIYVRNKRRERMAITMSRSVGVGGNKNMYLMRPISSPKIIL